MRRSIILVPITLVAILLLVESTPIHAPELFGDGQMYTIQAGDGIVGYVDAWGGWFIYGRVSDCRIVQIAGEPIGDVDGKIACHMKEKAERFSGWIDFRGHKRKFCGGDTLPAKCYGE